MTVASTTNRKTYTGDNVSTSFATSPVIFYLSSNLQVRVTVIATGVSTLLTENTHYTVSGGAATGATGTVNLAGGSSPHGALLSTEKLVILRVLPLTQASDFVNNSNSDAEVLEAALDKLTDVDQQLSERQDRALTFPEGDVSGSTTTLQDASVRAGRLLGFDALGVLTTLVVQIGTSLVDLASSIGASLVGFIASGIGAIARTVQDALRDRDSVFNYMTAAQRADVIAGTALVDVGAAIAVAIAAVPTSGGTLYFPSGTYAYATSPNFAKANMSIVCGQLTTFKYTGSGTALTLDAGANPAFINGMNIENLYVVGTVNATRGIYARGIGRSTFKNIIVTSLGPTAECLREEFCLLNTWINFKVSLPGPAPKYGIYLARRNVGENTTSETFINPCIESVSTAGGAGIFLDWASSNTFIGGTSEANDTGIWLTANAVGNTFYDTDLEGNAVRDINCLGPDNTFVKPLSAGTILVSGASALRNMFISPYFSTVTFDATCDRTVVVGGVIKTSATDASVTTTWMGTYNANAASPVPAYIHGGINVSEGNVSLAGGKLYPATDALAAQTVAGVFAGNGAPNNANGGNGDFYFRGDGTQAGNTVIYHKQAGAWVALVTT